MVQNKSQLSQACQMVMNKYAPADAAPVQTALDPRRPVAHCGRLSMRTASNTRPGKPLNILAR